MSAPHEKTYLPAADILRVLAIGTVGWYHIWQQSWLDPSFRIGNYYVNLQQIVRHGYLMVDVLLVLSGFLLILPHARARRDGTEAPSIRQFYVNRFWRIVPSYALAVLGCFFLYALPKGAYASAGFALKDLVAHLTFTHTLFPDTYLSTPLPGVLWTMGVEVPFYLLFPILAALYRERPGLTFIALTLIAAAYRLWVYFQPSTVFYVNQLPAMLDLYACGMLAGHLYVRFERRSLKRGASLSMALAALAALAALIGILYTQPVADHEVIRRHQLLCRLPIGVVTGVFLLAGCRIPPGLSRALGNPVTRFLAAISYNFYIWHAFIAVRLKELRIPAYLSENPSLAGEQPWQTRYTLLCFALAVAAAALVTYIWEKPAARRFFSHRTE